MAYASNQLYHNLSAMIQQLKINLNYFYGNAKGKESTLVQNVKEEIEFLESKVFACAALEKEPNETDLTRITQTLITLYAIMPQYEISTYKPTEARQTLQRMNAKLQEATQRMNQ
jgi:hypothetical protein